MLRDLEPSVTDQTDFIPIGAVKRSLDGLAKEFGFRIEEDTDDLGRVRCAYLETDGGRRFLLRRYATYPELVVDLFIPSQLPDRQQAVDDIIDELNLRREDLVPGEHAYGGPE